MSRQLSILCADWILSFIWHYCESSLLTCTFSTPPQFSFNSLLYLRCYLVTFYFIRYLLASTAIATNVEGKESSIDSWTETSKGTGTTTATDEEEKVVDFIRAYGAYLKLHTCIVRASDAGSGPILRALLDMARFDLRHRDCLTRLTNKQTTFFLYESVSFYRFDHAGRSSWNIALYRVGFNKITKSHCIFYSLSPHQAMLSAILVRLKQINNGENANEALLRIVPLLVSAYPDLKPKVVRGALLGATSSTSPPTDTDLHQRRTGYYRYLSLLLDADEGVDSARSDGRLVEVSYLIISVVRRWVKGKDRRQAFHVSCLAHSPILLSLLACNFVDNVHLSIQQTTGMVQTID